MNLFSRRTIKPTADITPDVLAFWRRKYPDAIFEFSENGNVGYFRKLTVKELENELNGFIQAPISESGKENDATDFCIKLIELSMLGGNAEILNTEPYKTMVLQQVGAFVMKNVKDTFPDIQI